MPNPLNQPFSIFNIVGTNTGVAGAVNYPTGSLMAGGLFTYSRDLEIIGYRLSSTFSCAAAAVVGAWSVMLVIGQEANTYTIGTGLSMAMDAHLLNVDPVVMPTVQASFDTGMMFTRCYSIKLAAGRQVALYYSSDDTVASTVVKASATLYAIQTP